MTPYAPKSSTRRVVGVKVFGKDSLSSQLWLRFRCRFGRFWGVLFTFEAEVEVERFSVIGEFFEYIIEAILAEDAGR